MRLLLMLPEWMPIPTRRTKMELAVREGDEQAVAASRPQLQACDM